MRRLAQRVDDRVGDVLRVKHLGARRLAVLFERLGVAAEAEELGRGVAGLYARDAQALADGLKAQGLQRGLDEELRRAVDAQAREDFCGLSGQQTWTSHALRPASEEMATK